jgi:hypothetical protein
METLKVQKYQIGDILAMHTAQLNIVEILEVEKDGRLLVRGITNYFEKSVEPNEVGDVLFNIRNTRYYKDAVSIEVESVYEGLKDKYIEQFDASKHDVQAPSIIPEYHQKLRDEFAMRYMIANAPCSPDRAINIANEFTNAIKEQK